ASGMSNAFRTPWASAFPVLPQGRAMKIKLFALFTPIVILFTISPSQADLVPPDLAAGWIQVWNGSYVTGEVYQAGNYVFTYPGGRTATLEIKEGNGPWVMITSAKLPDISGAKPYYITGQLLGPIRNDVTTTIRLRLSPGDGRPGNDMSTKVFRPF